MHHQKAIAQYRGCLNLLAAPINTLPREILGIIFKLYVEYYVKGLRLKFSRDMLPLSAKPYLWIKLAHVCRYWRGVVLSHAALFTYVRATEMMYRKQHRDFLRDYLSISGQSPLDVDGELVWHDPHPESIWWLLVPKLHRLASLQLRLSPFINFLNEWPVCPTTKEFTCHIYEHPYIPTPQICPSLQQILMLLPNLERLTINFSTAFQTTFPAIPLPFLAYLSIHRMQYIPDRFVEALKLLPCLQSLKITEMYTTEGMEIDPELWTPLSDAMPRLHDLEVSSYYLPAISSLMQLLPDVNTLNIDFTQEAFRDEASFGQLGLILSKQLGAIQALDLRFWNDHTIQMVGWDIRNIAAQSENICIIHFDFPFHAAAPRFRARTTTLLTNLFCQMINVQSLKITLPSDDAVHHDLNLDPILYQAAVYFQELRLLSLSSPSDDWACFSQLAYALAGETEPGNYHHGFPRLQELYLSFKLAFSPAMATLLERVLLSRAGERTVAKIECIWLIHGTPEPHQGRRVMETLNRIPSLVQHFYLYELI